MGEIIEHHDHQQQNGTVTGCLAEQIRGPRGQKVLEDVGAIERWYRKQVEDPEAQVHEQRVDEELLIYFPRDEKGSG